MNSFNHYAYGAIGEWMYRVMAGLESDEKTGGFRHGIFYPRPGGGLSWAEGSYRSVYGEEYVRWEQERNEVMLRVKIPANTTAEIRLDRGGEVLEGDGLTFAPAGNYLTADAGSGEYAIKYRMK